MKFYLGIGLLVATTFAFALQLALPSSPPAVAMRTGIGWVVETLRSSTTVGAYRLFLTDGETAQEISTADAEALLAERAAGSPTLAELVGGPDATCRLISGSGSGQLLVCAPSTLAGLDPATPLTEAAAIALRATESGLERRQRLSRHQRHEWPPGARLHPRLGGRLRDARLRLGWRRRLPRLGLGRDAQGARRAAHSLARMMWRSVRQIRD